MKKLIGKIHNTESSLSKMFVIEKREITEIRNIAEESLFYKILTKSSQKCFRFFKLIHWFLTNTHRKNSVLFI